MGGPLMARTPFDLDHFRFRMIQDAMNEATEGYWRRRADQLEDSIPRAGDFHGRATYADLAARAIRLQQTVHACRNRATLCELSDHEVALIFALMDYAEDITSRQNAAA
jgi:hypothetical protein